MLTPHKMVAAAIMPLFLFQMAILAGEAHENLWKSGEKRKTYVRSANSSAEEAKVTDAKIWTNYNIRCKVLHFVGMAE